MRRILIGLLVVALLAAAFLYFGGAERLGITLPGQPPAADSADMPAAAETPLPEIQASGDVIADGAVLPVLAADLSMSGSGVVTDVLVEEGATVAEGDLLLQLQNTREVAAVEQARAALFRAQAQLEELRAGPRQEEIDAAQAAVDSAQARLDQLAEPAREEEIAAGEADLVSAEAALAALYRGPRTTESAALKADLADSEARLNQARSEYNKVSWSSEIGTLPQSLALQEATNAYEAAKARYDDLFASPYSDEVASAQARVKQAEAALDKLLAPATPSQIAEAEAEVRRNQANLDQLLAGSRPEEIARFGADVADAQARLMQAEADLAETELRAPFAGTVAFLDVMPGEQVNAGSVVVQIADLSTWQVETSDLTEIDIVDVQVGDRAELTFDAVDDLEMSGTVRRIRPIGENKQGDIVYTVIIEPDTQDSRLRWNMTAVVRIAP